MTHTSDKTGHFKSVFHLEFFIKVGSGGHGFLHHVWSDREVFWQLFAPLDHPGVGAIQALVPKEPVLFPVIHTVFWSKQQHTQTLAKDPEL